MSSKSLILGTIGERIVALKVLLGEAPVCVNVTPKEYQILKGELQAKGEVLMINGVHLIQVEAPSPLDHPIAVLGKAYEGLNEVTVKEISPTAFPAGFFVTPEWKTGIDFSKNKAPKVYHTSNKDTWGTPQAFFDCCTKECAFDLDVCADLQNSKCSMYLSEEMDALSIDWWGKVWMNPPYTKVGQFLNKLLTELEAGHIESAWALVAARTDTHWFFTASSYAAEIRFLKGRLQFETPGKPLHKSMSAPFPSALLIFDRKIKDQGVVFWDWKKSVKTHYKYGDTKPYAKGMASLLKKSKLNQGLLHDYFHGIVKAEGKGEWEGNPLFTGITPPTGY